jgi:hypothetical protein
MNKRQLNWRMELAAALALLACVPGTMGQEAK